MANNRPNLKFIALSGTTDVTENMYVYEYGNDMIVVDCGVGFPDAEMLGVDLVIPDFTYIRQNKHKLRGIVITHGHEDHLGAVPFLLKEVDAQVYASKLTAGFIEDKLADYDIRGKRVSVFNPESDTLTLGNFKVMPFRISHSVPDAVGLAIDTPEGRVFHVPDYKFDWTPVDGRPFDIQRAVMLASNGALALASDSLGSMHPGHTESELKIESIIEEIVHDAKNRVFFTTISSNISRMQQAINVAAAYGRQVAFAGRSVEQKAATARHLGYLHYPNGIEIPLKKAMNKNKDQVMIIISGSYGQPGSALYRAATGEHDLLEVEQGDTVIFSGDPAPPGTKANVDSLVDHLLHINADVHYYDMQEDLHVSGHGSQEDIRLLFGIIKPKYFIPIGGTVRHMRAYSKMAQEMGAKESDIFELAPGDTVEFSQGRARKGVNIPVHDVLVDGTEIGDVGKVVLRDRHILAQEGIVVAIVPVDKNNKRLDGEIEIVSRGFVFERKRKDLINLATKHLENELKNRKMLNQQTVRDEVPKVLGKFFFKETGRQPMIVPVVIET
jgi:ribonuclease J